MYDVLVIGAGPAGSSCAYWLSQAGWDVAIVEKKSFPREKTCGDGLTPRAVRQLGDMGLEPELSELGHRFTGLRAQGFGQSVEMTWPAHSSFPSYGYCIRRHDLDEMVAKRAVDAGATLFQKTEAEAPILTTAKPDDMLPYCLGAVVCDKVSGEVREIKARYLVVADGSNSRIGRALGAKRRRDYPLGMALRGYYRSDRSEETLIESHLDIRSADGEVLPGYGWIFPMGNGTVNVGVGLLTIDPRYKAVNTSRLMEDFVSFAPKPWGLSRETSCGPPTGGKLPMALSVEPKSGPNAVLIGDAMGSINPFNGEGIAYGYETGRLAATAIGSALGDENHAAVPAYGETVADAYKSYYRVARGFLQVIARPKVMRVCVGTGLRSEFVMTQLLRVMANLMRPDALGPAEVAYAGMDLAAKVAAKVTS